MSGMHPTVCTPNLNMNPACISTLPLAVLALQACWPSCPQVGRPADAPLGPQVLVSAPRPLLPGQSSPANGYESKEGLTCAQQTSTGAERKLRRSIFLRIPQMQDR